jgi:hypothetical protein
MRAQDNIAATDEQSALPGMRTCSVWLEVKEEEKGKVGIVWGIGLGH